MDMLEGRNKITLCQAAMKQVAQEWIDRNTYIKVRVMDVSASDSNRTFDIIIEPQKEETE